MQRVLIFLLSVMFATLLLIWYVQDQLPTVELPSLSFLEDTPLDINECILELPDPPINQQCILKIGIINSFSNNDGCFPGGTEHKRGYELAVNELNENVGIDGCFIELIQIDDKASAAQAGAAVGDLANQDVGVIIGAYSSGATNIAAAQADQLNIPLIVPSASSELITELGYEWVFRINATSASYVSQALNFTTTLSESTKEGLKVAVIYENTVFGESAAVAVTSQAENLGISVVAYETYQRGTSSFVGEINSIKGAQPDVVYLVSSRINDAQGILKTSQDLNLRPQLFIANAGAFVSPDLLDNVGPEAENVVVTAQWASDLPWRIEGGVDTETFVRQFREKYNGESPGMRSVQTYTSLFIAQEVLADAIKRDNCQSPTQLRLCVREGLRNLDLGENETLFGAINFDDQTGQNEHPVILVQIVPDGDGYRLATIYPEEFRTQEVILTDDKE